MGCGMGGMGPTPGAFEGGMGCGGGVRLEPRARGSGHRIIYVYKRCKSISPSLARNETVFIC